VVPSDSTLPDNRLSFFLLTPPPPTSTLFPYTTLFRSNPGKIIAAPVNYKKHLEEALADKGIHHGNLESEIHKAGMFLKAPSSLRSEEHTSELQSPYDLVCRLLLEKKNITTSDPAGLTR